MLVQLNYLKNHRAVDAGPLLSALCQAVEESAVDPGRLAVPLDWVQYRKNFRPAVDARRYLLPDGSADSAHELAIDVRRLADADVAPALRGALAYLSGAAAVEDAPLVLEEF